MGHKLVNEFKQIAEKKLPQTPYITEHRDHYLKLLTIGQWDQLESESKKQSELAEKTFSEFRSHQSQISRVYTQANKFAVETLKNWVPLKSRQNWPDIKNKILAGLPPGTSRHDAEKEIKKLGGLSKNDMLDRFLNPIILRSSLLDETISSSQAAQLGAELALTVARFNQYKHPNLIPTKKIDDWLKASSSLILNKEKEIWDALKKGKVKTVRDKSDKLLAWSKGATLLKATRTAAALALSRENPVNRWSLGPTALMTANLISNLFMSQLLGLRLAWLARFGFGPLVEWCDTAAKLPFPSVWQPPAVTSIASLWSKMDQLDGKTVTIEGVVGAVQNKHKRNKVYSSVWLTDNEGMSMRVGILYIKMDSGGSCSRGLRKGNRKVYKKDKDFGTPVVRISRRTLVEDSKHSWKGWVERQNQFLFTPIPHALTISFSWERGINGPGNLFRYGTWLPNQRRM